jgi:hypothetical protein
MDPDGLVLLLIHPSPPLDNERTEWRPNPMQRAAGESSYLTCPGDGAALEA